MVLDLTDSVPHIHMYELSVDSQIGAYHHSQEYLFFNNQIDHFNLRKSPL